MTSLSGWMKDVSPTKYVKDMSLPGTHDTISYKGVAGFVNVQTKTLDEQLRPGIRVLDIRLVLKGANIRCHHNNAYLGLNFPFVVKTIALFLINSPFETIFMRIKDEKKTKHPAEFANRVRLDLAPVMRFLWKRHINPQLGELRRKLVIFDEFTGGK